MKKEWIKLSKSKQKIWLEKNPKTEFNKNKKWNKIKNFISHLKYCVPHIFSTVVVYILNIVLYNLLSAKSLSPRIASILIFYKKLKLKKVKKMKKKCK
jgi:hypothetical protein